MKISLSCLFLGLFFSFTACKKAQKYPDNAALRLVTVPFISYFNQLYGTDTLLQTMDVTLPLTRDEVNTPVVILVHGGSWVAGAKNDFYGLGLDTFFTSNGCAMVNINYRLCTSYPYPDALDDIGLVMNYIKRNASRWRVNPDRICILGRSSGSQLALLYAYSRNADKRIKAVIDGFGPTNLTDSTIVNTQLGLNVTNMLGDYATYPDLWHDASPIYHMNGAVPTVIFQGTVDELVYPKQSLMLQDSLIARSVPSLYIPWVGAGHGWSQENWIASQNATITFVKKYL